MGCNGNSQTGADDNMIQPDFEIGNYGISLKNKTIGRYRVFDCSDKDFQAECYGYFKADDINFNTTTLMFIGNEVIFKEDVLLDLETLQVITAGNNSQVDTKQKDALYVDHDIAVNNLLGNRVIDSLKGFKHLDKQFFKKGNSIAYLGPYGFHKLNNSMSIDLFSFKAVVKNLFYDKNAVYYVEYGYSEIEGEKYSDIIKLQGLPTNKKPNLAVTEHYVVINGKVYDINRLENELLLNPEEINEIVLQRYSGEMLLFDDKTVYDKQYYHYRFDEAKCETDYEKIEIQCLFKDLSTIKTLRRTGFTEYHLDEENKTLYFDANKDLNLTETSGNLYSIEGQFYFNDFDRFSLKLETVKVWNPDLDHYENLDLENYDYTSDVFYAYKGNLYGHHSERVQDNFSLDNVRVLETDNRDYIVNNSLIIDLKGTDNLNLRILKVLNSVTKDATGYLVGDNYLIYDNEIIKNVNISEITVLNKDVLKTATHLINKGKKIELSRLPFKIEVIR